MVEPRRNGPYREDLGPGIHPAVGDDRRQCPGPAPQAREAQGLPYFGRFDFASGGEPRPIYIGVHHFHDDLAGESRVHDWRAPIASLFYDVEPGPASYESPEGPVAGEVTLKRQFRIKGGEIELMIDSAVHVVDDVLQEELGRASDESMKNIVATIQRDQNAIIRNDEAQVLVIQGVAGSGKTSIALHRIAYPGCCIGLTRSAQVSGPESVIPLRA